jgi:hypothetical protein
VHAVSRAPLNKTLGVWPMTSVLNASEVAVTDTDDCSSIGFSGDASDSHEYVLLQRTKVHTSQAHALGMNTYHIERNDQSTSCYGGIATFELHRDRVAIQFDERAASHMRTNTLDVLFSIDPAEFERLRYAAGQLFRGTSCLVDKDAQPSVAADAPQASRR